MDLYLIHRRSFGSLEGLEAAAARSASEGDKPDSGVRWIRSYVVPNGDAGDVGTVCIYEAERPEAIRAHAAASQMGADEITRVLDTVVVRPDPVKVEA